MHTWKRTIHKNKMILFITSICQYIFLSNLLLFQVVRNYIIEIQIIKNNENHSQDLAINSFWTIPQMGFYLI